MNCQTDESLHRPIPHSENLSYNHNIELFLKRSHWQGVLQRECKAALHAKVGETTAWLCHGVVRR